MRGPLDANAVANQSAAEGTLDLDVTDAIVENLRILFARDEAALNRGLIGFADLLTTNDLVATVRFPARDFTRWRSSSTFNWRTGWSTSGRSHVLLEGVVDVAFVLLHPPDTRMTTRPPDDDPGGQGPRRRRFLTPRTLSAALRAASEVTDEDFNAFLPARYQGAGHTHASPVAVAVRAAQLLAAGGAARVLEVGSGIGTFGIVGALTTPAFYVGIEPNLPIVVAARGTAARFGASRVRFFHGDVSQIDFRLYDAIYLFSPEVRRTDREPHGGVESRAGISEALAWQKVEETRPGTRILAAGGRSPPPGCRPVNTEMLGSIELLLFERD